MIDYIGTVLYEDCKKRIESPELLMNLNTELNIVEHSGIPFTTNFDLDMAFIWRHSPQGSGFWGDICHGRTPKEYQ